MNGDDSVFLSHARDMLDIEMSGKFKYARDVLDEAAKKLKEAGVCYILKICESENGDDESCVSMNIACKSSEMNVANAGALLEYEQQRFVQFMNGLNENDS